MKKVKRHIYLFLLATVVLFSCSHTREKQIQNLQNQISNLEEQNTKLQNEIEGYKQQLIELENSTFKSSIKTGAISSLNEESSNWQHYESTNLQTVDGDNIISGTISEGYIFKSLSGHHYRANPLTLQVVVAVMPNAEIYSNGSVYKLIIEDFDEPVFCQIVQRR